MEKMMNVKLKIWRQDGPDAEGKFVTYEVKNVSSDSSFLEMLDILNEQLIKQGERMIEFESDCREGICGNCGMVVNGVPHGHEHETCTCQLYMRKFDENETIVLEPFRAKAFPVIKDLVVDRSAFDRIIQKGGYISVNTGSAPDANSIPIPKEDAEMAMDAAECIGCGACVASCPNASAALFVSAKITQLAKLPQGQPEAKRRVLAMVNQMDLEGFGACSNHGECEATCPKGISLVNIAKLRREYLKAGIASI